MQEKGLTYKLLLEGDEVAEAYSVKGLPTLYVIGPDGKILFGDVGSGEDHYERLVEIIEQNLPH